LRFARLRIAFPDIQLGLMAEVVGETAQSGGGLTPGK